MVPHTQHQHQNQHQSQHQSQHQAPQLGPTSWSSARTRSRVSSLGWDVWSSPPPPAPSGSWAGPGSLCTWPHRPRPGRTPPRCWNREKWRWGWGTSESGFSLELSCCLDARWVTVYNSYSFRVFLFRMWFLLMVYNSFLFKLLPNCTTGKKSQQSNIPPFFVLLYYIR